MKMNRIVVLVASMLVPSIYAQSAPKQAVIRRLRKWAPSYWCAACCRR